MIMVVVFGVFATTGVPQIKEIGVGLAVAIALDATLVRLVLVPATMELMGDWNWWMPKWLDRILPEADFESDHCRRGRARARRRLTADEGVTDVTQQAEAASDRDATATHEQQRVPEQVLELA